MAFGGAATISKKVGEVPDRAVDICYDAQVDVMDVQNVAETSNPSLIIRGRNLP